MQIFLIKIFSDRYGTMKGDEARHCVRVLRHKLGDEVHCIDGEGRKYLGEIRAIEKERVELKLSEPELGWGETTTHIRLGVSPLRLKDRFEWLLEKAVELGVDDLVPVTCHRTHAYKGKWKPTRLRSIILAATKQAKRSKVPNLHSPIPLGDFVAEEQAQQRLMAYCEATRPVQELQQPLQQAQSVSLLIGPEGDFTEEEVELAQRHQFEVVSLGGNRLRTETAGAFALGAVKLFQGY